MLMLRRTILARLGSVCAKNLNQKTRKGDDDNADVVPCDIIQKPAAILLACRAAPGRLHLSM
jgi:hypothetical protein